jgi:hypothetical protein
VISLPVIDKNDNLGKDFGTEFSIVSQFRKFGFAPSTLTDAQKFVAKRSGAEWGKTKAFLPCPRAKFIYLSLASK